MRLCHLHVNPKMSHDRPAWAYLPDSVISAARMFQPDTEGFWRCKNRIQGVEHSNIGVGRELPIYTPELFGELCVYFMRILGEEENYRAHTGQRCHTHVGKKNIVSFNLSKRPRAKYVNHRLVGNCDTSRDILDIPSFAVQKMSLKRFY